MILVYGAGKASATFANVGFAASYTIVHGVLGEAADAIGRALMLATLRANFSGPQRAFSGAIGYFRSNGEPSTN